jgi:N-acyl-D-amino-acid deacylase
LTFATQKEGRMAQFDTIIKGGTVVDGTKVPRYRADIGIKNGKIAQIGRLQSSDAAKVIDATGLIVAPGFVDLHCHYDAQLIYPRLCRGFDYEPPKAVYPYLNNLS